MPLQGPVTAQNKHLVTCQGPQLVAAKRHSVHYNSLNDQRDGQQYAQGGFYEYGKKQYRQIKVCISYRKRQGGE